MTIRDGVFADPASLSQAKAVGQGFNVYGSFDASSLTRPLVDPAKAGTTTFRFQGVSYLVPDYVIGVENVQSYVVKTVAEDREAAQEEISVHAGVGASYGAFSGEIQSDFDYSSDTTSDSYYCYWRSFNQLAILETNPDLAKAAISDDFAAAVAALPLPLSEENQTDYFDFFALYGPFYTRSVTLGGDLSIFNEVTKSTSVTSASLEFALKAQYDGLYVTGDLDLSGLTTAQWDAYRSSSNVSIKGLGGDQSILASLAGVDPWTFSTASATLATAWAKSLGEEPGLVDFSLGGVWELIADPQRSAAVQEAWQLFAQVMHPRLSIESWSAQLPWPCRADPRTPIVIGSKIIKPTTPITSPIGAQVTILAGNDPVSEHAVQFNQYYSLPLADDWSSNYATMWNQIASDVLGKYDQNGDILLLVTFGLDANMPPTDEAAALLKTAGSGNALTTWIDTCNPGSEVGTPGLWTGYPCVYAFVGAFGNEQGSSVEVVTRTGSNPAEVNLTVYLYREAYDGQYTIALG